MEFYLQKIFFLLILINLSVSCSSQNTGQTELIVNKTNISHQNADTIQRLKMLFIGDIMEHDLQDKSSFNIQTGKYDFSEQFIDIQSIIKNADVTIANFEVTLSLEPYKGYPKFSTPDELASAVKEAGINYVVLANNHINDYSQRGLERTLRVIDSVGLKRTGVFYNEQDRKRHNPMIVEKNGFRIAVFNYTYGLNNDTLISPNIVNFVDSSLILNDFKNAEKENFDARIVFFHWGKEYERVQDSLQDVFADLCFRNGANVIIGSHPHVIQPMKFFDYQFADGSQKKVLVAFSLGNYVSNYGNWRYCDGGAMIQFTIEKKNNQISIVEPKYHLVWVYRKPKGNGLRHYYVLPVKNHKYDKYMTEADKKQLNTFINDSRLHLNQYNINVPEAELPAKN